MVDAKRAKLSHLPQTENKADQVIGNQSGLKENGKHK